MTSAAPLAGAVRTHLDNAAQLIELVSVAHLQLKTTAWLDQLCQRSEANLDGLRIAGEYALDLAEDHLEDEPEAAAVLAILLAESTDLDPSPRSRQRVTDLLAHPSEDVRAAAQAGLRLAPCCRSLEDELRATGPSCAALDVLAFHRIPVPSHLQTVPDSEEALYLFVEAVGRSTLCWSARDLKRFTGSPIALQIQRAAWRASAKRGTAELLPFCRDRAATGDAAALEFLGVIGSAEDLPLLVRAVETSRNAQAALDGLGRLAVIAAIPFLIDTLEDTKLAESAASAFERITGISVMRGEIPSCPPAGLTEDELDIWEARGPIDVDATRQWWRTNAHRFEPGDRWQAGLNVSRDTLRDEIFERLPLRLRYDSFLRERALRPAITPDWELETWLSVQKVPGSRGRGDR